MREVVRQLRSVRYPLDERTPSLRWSRTLKGSRGLAAVGDMGLKIYQGLLRSTTSQDWVVLRRT